VRLVGAAMDDVEPEEGALTCQHTGAPHQRPGLSKTLPLRQAWAGCTAALVMRLWPRAAESPTPDTYPTQQASVRVPAMWFVNITSSQA
jgi:hypothetical protein